MRCAGVPAARDAVVELPCSAARARVQGTQPARARAQAWCGGGGRGRRGGRARLSKTEPGACVKSASTICGNPLASSTTSLKKVHVCFDGSPATQSASAIVARNAAHAALMPRRSPPRNGRFSSAHARAVAAEAASAAAHQNGPSALGCQWVGVHPGRHSSPARASSCRRAARQEKGSNSSSRAVPLSRRYAHSTCGAAAAPRSTKPPPRPPRYLRRARGVACEAWRRLGAPRAAVAALGPRPRGLPHQNGRPSRDGEGASQDGREAS